MHVVPFNGKKDGCVRFPVMLPLLLLYDCWYEYDKSWYSYYMVHRNRTGTRLFLFGLFSRLNWACLYDSTTISVGVKQTNGVQAPYYAAGSSTVLALDATVSR